MITLLGLFIGILLAITMPALLPFMVGILAICIGLRLVIRYFFTKETV